MPNGNDDDAWSGDADADNPSEEAEKVEAEVVEQHNPALTPEVEALSTFAEQEGPLSFRILPVIEGGATDWRVLVYMRGVQGPVYQSRDGLSDGARAEFGVSTMLQEQINEGLRYAKENLHVPEELGDKKRQKRTLHELTLMREQEA